jgi:methyl-accepting chemotaxis protein
MAPIQAESATAITTALPRMRATTAGSVRSAEQGVSGFFRYHGAWAPGVRMFRALGFRTKAWIISAVFAVPMVWLSWQYFSFTGDAVAFSAKEHVGVEYTRELVPLLLLLQQQRAGEAGVSGALQPQLKRLAAVEQRDGAALGTTQAYQSFAQAIAQAADRLEPSAQEAALTRQIEALLALVGVVADGSNLTLDPDIDSYYLMDAAMFRLLPLMESVERMRALGVQLLKDGQLAPADLRRLGGEHLSASLNADQVRSGLGKVSDYNPGLAPQFKAAASLEELKPLLAQVDQLVDLPRAGDSAALEAQARRVRAMLVQLQRSTLDQMDRVIAQRVERTEQARRITLGVLVFCLGLAGYLFVAFRKVLEGGLREVALHIDAMRDGDLTTSPRAWGRDEVAGLMHTLVQMQNALRHIVDRVRGSSDMLVHSSSEIAVGAMDLSTRTEESAANLEQSAASMEQIASTVKNTAQHTQEASAMAGDNAALARRGGQIIGAMVNTMEDIHQSSSRIVDIIGVIDGIAFQTNILALNAAVEAARAGESGRGFAVVATEVRVLAQRSADAAREIKTLISASNQQVENGTQVVREAGDIIADIVSKASGVNGLLADIATGTQEQSLGVSQVSEAVHEMDRVTQQNAALVEQTAAAAASVKEHAAQLAEEVARFRMPGGVTSGGLATGEAGFQFDTAIEAHRAWKAKLLDAIREQGQLDAETLCRDDRCALGQWLHGAGRQGYGRQPRFVALIEQHRRFHLEAGAVARDINAKQYTQAQQRLMTGSAFHQASTEVVAALMEARRHW